MKGRESAEKVLMCVCVCLCVDVSGAETGVGCGNIDVAVWSLGRAKLSLCEREMQ